jgi:hypothetical protein
MVLQFKYLRHPEQAVLRLAKGGRVEGRELVLQRPYAAQASKPTLSAASSRLRPINTMRL